MAFLLFVCTNMIRKNPWSVAYFWLRPQAAPCLGGEFFAVSPTRRAQEPTSFCAILSARVHADLMPFRSEPPARLPPGRYGFSGTHPVFAFEART